MKNSPGKAHFIGISGMGMSAVAVLLKEKGWEISGSDEGSYEPAHSYLLSKGIQYNTEYAKENIPTDVDLIVIGKHAKLTEENEEVKAAFDSGKQIKSFAEILHGLTKETENTVVAGSYGKSTCTSLLAWCLIDAGLDPNYFIGALPIDMTQTSHAGNGKQFILEGDEYPSANWDATSKFLYLNANNVLLTSGEHDHINVYPTLAEYLAPFRKLLASLPSDGIVMAAINHPNVPELIKETKAKIITYGLDNATWWAKDISYGETTTFKLMRDQEEIVELTTPLLGVHNIENIVGVGGFVLEKKLLTPEQLTKAIQSFHGIKRRLDSKTEKSSVLVYEGFGSSYTKAKTVFDALKLHFPDRDVIAIFEPHTFSWRNRGALDWYEDVFDGIREVLVYEPPSHGAATHDQLSQEEIISKIKEKNPNVYGIRNKEEGLKVLNEIVRPNDLIVLVSSGEIGGLIQAVPLFVEEKFPKN